MIEHPSPGRRNGYFAYPAATALPEPGFRTPAADSAYPAAAPVAGVSQPHRLSPSIECLAQTPQTFLDVLRGNATEAKHEARPERDIVGVGLQRLHGQPHPRCPP